MSHFDKLVRLPEGFVVVAKTANSEFAGIAHQTKPIFGEFSPHLHPSSHLSDRYLLCSFALLHPYFTVSIFFLFYFTYLPRSKIINSVPTD